MIEEIEDTMSKRAFEFNDLVECTFRGKPTYGLVVTKDGEHLNRKTLRCKKSFKQAFEHRYHVKVLETKRPQVKWAHELKFIESSKTWDAAILKLTITHHFHNSKKNIKRS